MLYLFILTSQIKYFPFNYYECCNPMLFLNVVKLTVVLTNSDVQWMLYSNQVFTLVDVVNFTNDCCINNKSEN